MTGKNIWTQNFKQKFNTKFQIMVKQALMWMQPLSLDAYLNQTLWNYRLRAVL